MAAPAYVYTIACVAVMLGEPEAWLEEIALMNLDRVYQGSVDTRLPVPDS